MTFRSLSRTAAMFALSITIVATAFGQEHKRRAVSPGSGAPPAAPADVVLTGTVLDATTNAPVIDAVVSSTGRSGHTDASGQFKIRLTAGKTAVLTFSRSGYETFTTNVTITGETSQTFRMTPKPTVRVRMTNGTAYDLDTDTVEFGYIAPFSGYNKDTHLNLCKGGGSSFTPDRADIRKITTGVQMNDPTCCAAGSVQAINVTLKSGDTSTAAFVDACFGYKVDIIAQDHKTAQPVYVHFSDVAEVTFP